MDLKDFVAIIFALTDTEIDELEFFWSCEDGPKLERLLLEVQNRLQSNPENPGTEAETDRT